MKTVLFVVKNMNVGGVEKSLLSLLDTIDQQQYRVDLLLLEESGGFLKDIPNWVNVIVYKDYAAISDALNKPPVTVIKSVFKTGGISRAISLMAGYAFAKITGDYSHYYRSVFRGSAKLSKHYDIAVAYTSLISYISWIVNYHVTADVKVGWIHFDVSQLQLDNRFFTKLHGAYSKIYVCSKQALDSFNARFPALETKSELRYNIVNATKILKLAEEPVANIREPGKKTIITLGRLSKEKGQDIIVDVAQQLKNSGYKFKWYLIGDGPLRKPIESALREHELMDDVILLGTKENPYPYLKQADIYVQSSVHEGYCITLAEAKVFGMPIVSTEFAGASEQLRSLSNGIVVKRDAQLLSTAIQNRE